MPSRQTKAALVTMALKLVGNAAADLQAEAELWLDLLLAELAGSYRFPELQRQHTASVASGLSSILYPSDYGFLVRDGNQRGAVGYLTIGSSRTAVFERLASEIRIPDAVGIPAVADDRYHSAWLAFMPSDGGTLALEYQSIPLTVDSTDVVWYPNDLDLIHQVKALAELYMRGSLLNVALQIKEAGRVLSLRSPSRVKLFTSGGPGSDLDPRWFS